MDKPEDFKKLKTSFKTFEIYIKDKEHIKITAEAVFDETRQIEDIKEKYKRYQENPQSHPDYFHEEKSFKEKFLENRQIDSDWLNFWGLKLNVMEIMEIREIMKLAKMTKELADQHPKRSMSFSNSDKRNVKRSRRGYSRYHSLIVFDEIEKESFPQIDPAELQKKIIEEIQPLAERSNLAADLILKFNNLQSNKEKIEFYNCNYAKLEMFGINLPMGGKKFREKSNWDTDEEESDEEERENESAGYQFDEADEEKCFS